MGKDLVHLDSTIEVSTSTKNSLWPTKMWKGCVITIKEVDLILLELQELDINLGMDWLVANHASVDCFNKDVTFRQLGLPKVVFCGECRILPLDLIYAMDEHHML